MRRLPKPLHAELLVCLVLALFLLPFFRPTGEVCLCKGPSLPQVSHHHGPPKDGPVVHLWGHGVMVDGVHVDALQGDDQGEPSPLPALVALLVERNLSSKSPGSVDLLVDRRVPAGAVKSVVQSCMAAGYQDIGFLVETTWLTAEVRTVR